ncbi:MAG: hypothetical protein JSV12_09335 [Candidatus Bathyarchaeota archaeon]|nr:MAG: hypothetical protein JSV12_09335 [Candidatus Bathyarchaeota archaeon]
MRKTKKTKGQMRLIEALLASFIIMFAITFLNVFAVTPLSPTYEPSNLEKMGNNVLHDLDEKKLLGRFVYNEDWGTLTLALMVSLPPEIYFDLTVYYLNWTVADNETMRYGNIEVFETSIYIASVTYIVPGYQTDYDPRILVLQLVRR